MLSASCAAINSQQTLWARGASEMHLAMKVFSFDTALGCRLHSVLQALEFEVLVSSSEQADAFLFLCSEASQIEAARQVAGRFIVALVGNRLDATTALGVGADRILQVQDDDAWQLLLRECYGTWKRSQKSHNYQRALEAVVENMSESVEITSPDVCIEYVNPAFTLLTGFLKEEAIGKSPGQFLRNDLHSKEFFESMERTWRRGEVWNGELLGKHRDASDTYSIATIIPVKGDAGEIVHGVALKQSVTLTGLDAASEESGRAALSRTLASEARYRDMVDAAEDLILVADMETGQIIDANRAALGAFGYRIEEIRQLAGARLVASSERKIIRRITNELSDVGRARAHRMRMKRQDGALFWGSVILRVFTSRGRKCQLGVIRDISDDVAREEELDEANQKLLHSARLAAVGRLSAGVAHEINNPATFVKSNIEILLESEEGNAMGAPMDHEERVEALQDALIGILRIEAVAKQLVSFARTPRVMMKSVNLNSVIDVALRMTANEIRHRAKLELNLDSELPSILLDESRLGQVVTNLLVNAAHAIEEGNKEGNVIAVSSSTAEGNVVVRIRDTGHGMSKDVCRRALEPFFTTKKAGVGTGLGLALCVDILAAHGGKLTLESAEGVGTTVEIQVPIALEGTGRAPTDKGTEEQEESPARILCIDDEKLVLRTYRRCIARKHDVVLASGGREALTILEKDQDFDLIVCDMMMPNLDGPSVYQELTKLDQGLAERLVFCTGGAFTERSRDFLETWNGIVLNKPVDRTDLSSALRLIRSSAKS